MLQEEEEQMALINVVKTHEAAVGSGRGADSVSVLAPGVAGSSLFFFFSAALRKFVCFF